MMKTRRSPYTVQRIGLMLRWVFGCTQLLVGITMVVLGGYFLANGSGAIGAITLLLGLPLLSVEFLRGRCLSE